MRKGLPAFFAGRNGVRTVPETFVVTRDGGPGTGADRYLSEAADSALATLVACRKGWDLGPGRPVVPGEGGGDGQVWPWCSPARR
jgi:hypothetical protein